MPNRTLLPPLDAQGGMARPDSKDPSLANRYDVRMQHLRATRDAKQPDPAPDWYAVNGLVSEARRLSRRAARLLEMVRDHRCPMAARKLPGAVGRAREARRDAVRAMRREWRELRRRQRSLES